MTAPRTSLEQAIEDAIVEIERLSSIVESLHRETIYFRAINQRLVESLTEISPIKPRTAFAGPEHLCPKPADERRIDNLRRIAADESVNNFARSICAEAADYIEAIRARADQPEHPSTQAPPTTRLRTGGMASRCHSLR